MREIRLRTTPMPGKNSGLPAGVSQRIYNDQRRARHYVYLMFSVNWRDSHGQTRVSSFSAGNIETASRRRIERARVAAVAFRRAYERAVAAGKPFDPARARWSVARG
jgi:hypothetical protein